MLESSGFDKSSSIDEFSWCTQLCHAPRQGPVTLTPKQLIQMRKSKKVCEFLLCVVGRLKPRSGGAARHRRIPRHYCKPLSDPRLRRLIRPTLLRTNDKTPSIQIGRAHV